MGEEDFKVKKSTIFVLVLISITMIIGIPLFIDWIIIGNSFPSNIGNADWVGFFGGYIGALIGAVVSLVGILITIRYTNEQNKKERELQVRPYCAIRYVHDNKVTGTNKILAEWALGCEPRENNAPEYISILYFKNIGLGPGVVFEFEIDPINDGREHYPIIIQNNADISNRWVSILQPNEEAAFPLHFHFNFDKIADEDFDNYGETEMPKYFVKSDVMQKYKNFDITIHVKYKDLFQNQYYQKIILSSNMYVCGGSEKKQAEHRCDINLKEITNPIKI